MHVSWSQVELVLAIADTGSLTGAARRLGVTQPTVSRRLAELEAELGDSLFLREVAGARPTGLGERLIEPARRMADAAAEVERIASGTERGPRGVVRITAPPGVAYTLLAPFAAELRGRLPEIRLHVVSTVRYVDLVRGEADLAIRMPSPGRRRDQRDLAVLGAATHPIAAFASPAYAARLPRGYGVADVDWIGWPPPLEDLVPNPQLAARIPGFRPVFAADDFLVQLRAAEAGVGAIILDASRTRFGPAHQLVPLALDLGKLTASVQLVAARAALAVPRVREVGHLLAAELAPPPPGRRQRRLRSRATGGAR